MESDTKTNGPAAKVMNVRRGRVSMISINVNQPGVVKVKAVGEYRDGRPVVLLHLPDGSVIENNVEDDASSGGEASTQPEC